MILDIFLSLLQCHLLLWDDEEITRMTMTIEYWQAFLYDGSYKGTYINALIEIKIANALDSSSRVTLVW
jgi:hypothetical protein